MRLIVGPSQRKTTNMKMTLRIPAYATIVENKGTTDKLIRRKKKTIHILVQSAALRWMRSTWQEHGIDAPTGKVVVPTLIQV